MKAVIKVENNLLEILKFLEYKDYKWASGDLPTVGINWGIKLILINGKTLMHSSITSYDPNAITFEEFKNKIDMKRSNILPGHKLVLENGNVFVVMEYKNTKIVLPEGSSRSVLSLDELCDENLTPRQGVSCIMRVLNAINVTIWERKITRSDIKAGFTLTNENGVKYLVVENDCNLRIMNMDSFIVGPKLCDIMNEDISPFISFATIVEIKDKEGKIIYKKSKYESTRN